MVSDEEFSRLRAYVNRFMVLPEPDFAAMQQRMVRQTVPKGGHLLKAGEVCTGIAFINKGHLRSYCLVKGEEVTYNFWFEGNFITDYSSFLTRQPSSETHEALDDVEVITVSYDDMQDLYKQFPGWDKFGRLIAEFIIIGIAERNRAMLFLSPEEQYLNLMKTRPKVFANVPQHYIASYLGLRPESLSRIRKRLATAKKI
ncbi:MAG: Crp/Fnr family transcriptional regulator [Cyclobacteriaceae bacterium]|nr:Crp/Fnr family transcriptional regulator [Cyclobacteriaceae bacterium]